MLTFRPIENAVSIIEYHRDSLVGYYSGSGGSDVNARWIAKLRELFIIASIGSWPAQRAGSLI